MLHVPRDGVLMQDVNLGPFRRIALFGGIYSNYLSLERAIALAKAKNVDAMIALGDFGAFGPHPDRTVEILRASGIPAIQGNYEESLATGAENCHCGYRSEEHTSELQSLRHLVC